MTSNYQHGTAPQTTILLVNLGTPDAPTAAAVRPYLRQFLSDPRVVEIPKAVWWFILNGIILPFRSGKSAAKYATIWSSESSPLKVFTEKQAKLLQGLLGERGHHVQVRYAMRYGNPGIDAVLQELKSANVERILMVPLYPQYSATTTASSQDALFDALKGWRNQPELRLIKHYHDHPAYIKALAAQVAGYWARNGKPNFMAGEQIVFSFHGTPKRTLLLGDPYHCECLKTGRLLGEALGLDKTQYQLAFQSRFGKAEWLQPYMVNTLTQLGKAKTSRLDVFCPGFPADCLETLEEIAIEGKAVFQHAGGGQYHYIPCLNDSQDWISGLADMAEQHLLGWPTSQAVDTEQLAQSRARALAAGASK